MTPVTTKDVRVLKVWPPAPAKPQIVSLKVDGYGCYLDWKENLRKPGDLIYKVTYPRDGSRVPSFLLGPMWQTAYAILFPKS